MREIKFRAWDREFMIEWENMKSVSLHELSESIIIDAPGEGDQLDIVAMQYTGLKDKNDKEIYEGDIVEYWYSNRNGAWKYRKEVKYIICCYGVTTYNGFTIISDINRKCKVIGNIHENPELLKEGK